MHHFTSSSVRTKRIVVTTGFGFQERLTSSSHFWQFPGIQNYTQTQTHLIRPGFPVKKQRRIQPLCVYAAFMQGLWRKWWKSFYSFSSSNTKYKAQKLPDRVSEAMAGGTIIRPYKPLFLDVLKSWATVHLKFYYSIYLKWKIQLGFNKWHYSFFNNECP